MMAAGLHTGDIMRPGISFLSALLLAAALLVGLLGVGNGIERFRMADRSVTVKGLAELDVRSDYAVWSVRFRRAGQSFADVHQALADDRQRVVQFLRAQGFSDDELDPRPLKVQDLLAREWGSGQVALRFNGSGEVLVRSVRVERVEVASAGTDPLIAAGLQLDTDAGMGSPQYQLRGFNDIKPRLLAEVTANAREQAERFAADAGARLGALKSANQGVIQVIDDDGSGESFGRTIGKRLRVVSTFTYYLD